jgi:hypothetical protein
VHIVLLRRIRLRGWRVLVLLRRRGWRAGNETGEHNYFEHAPRTSARGMRLTM